MEKINPTCKICQQQTNKLFITKVRDKHDVQYYICPECSFVQTEEPYWLDEAYANPINISDTGIISRNLSLSKATASVLYFIFNSNQGKNFLDYAGGYGIMTRLMRDLGFNFYHLDPFCENIFARGLEYQPDLEIKFLTAFEVFEHFVEPLSEIEKMLAVSPNIFFSTWLLPQPTPQPQNWWYYGFEHGQHVAFYNLKTLQEIAHQFNLNFYTNQKNLHLLTKKGINPVLFRSTLKLKELLYFYIKKRRRSLTFLDHKRLMSTNAK